MLCRMRLRRFSQKMMTLRLLLMLMMMRLLCALDAAKR